jgi:UDP-N-acetylglucosamine--N-acetylmuramyl-(pentapeptide) pyrophosphoryl-undecaprenol N-acetylglucosamine transferase
VAHICGKGNLDAVLEGKPGYIQLEFLSEELPDVLACADLVLSRAGANALCEFQALGRPMLLVPYPKGASRGDQILNARSLEKRGLCRVLLQEDMTPETLAEAVEATWKDRERLTEALKNAPPADGTARVLELIEEIQK